jgi:CDP-glycerol glycerophosphotransferase (TagB/SpsB family)
MIKNIKIKKLLMGTVFRTFTGVNRLTKKKQNQILLYSNEGFRDNIKYLYDYLIEQGYNEQYHIICSANDYKKFSAHAPKNVSFVSNVQGILKYFSSAHIYYCFGRIPIVPTRDQVAIQMWHGTSFKGFDQSTRQTNALKNQYYTYVFASSEFFRPIVEKKFACLPENIYICGHPRTDMLYKNDVTYHLGDFQKTIIWLPTFRKSAAMGYTDVQTDSVVPFFKLNELHELDEVLQRYNVHVIIKLHPVQDIPQKSVEGLTHLQLLSHQEFTAKNYDLYTLLRQTDALITDYSSVFYDYLLLDRPIGFTEDDEEQYKSNRGFAVENPDDFKPGMRIKSREQLYQFVSDLVEGKDLYKQKRFEINELSNAYQDGQNCARALLASGIKK